MLNLTEYAKKPKLLSDYLPWGFLVGPGIILNKDGSFLRLAHYRGPDLESATEAELISVTARINNVLKRFGSGWALFFEAARKEASTYPLSEFPDPISLLVDEERRKSFEAEAGHFESNYTLALCWLPPAERQDKAGSYLVERGDDETLASEARGFEWQDHFKAETERALDLLATILPEIRFLDDEETLTHLHGRVSSKDHVVSVTAVPAYLDALLADTSFTAGMAPKLGDQHLRTLTILGLPGTTTPGLLDALNDLALAYTWVTRWIALDRTEAQTLLTRKRRQWFAKRKSVAAILREVLFNQETVLLDTDAASKAAETNEALEDLGSGDVAFGYVTTTVSVTAPTSVEAGEALRQIERVINTRGFVCITESFNAVEAWLGSLPGHLYANVRQPIVHTLNLAHIMPISSVWAGPHWNEHLNEPPLLHAATRGSTPFRVNLHVGDVGHTTIVGPTGAGKSVLLAMLALQFRRYDRGQVFIFDKGRSARAAALMMGGTALDLSIGGGIAFQPLADIDDPVARAFGRDWVLSLLSHEGVATDPAVKDEVWAALTNLASAPKPERTLTGLSLLLQSNRLRQALQPYALEGPWGSLLDGKEDRFSFASVMHFELEGLMETKGLVLPVLTYLFHRLESHFDGRPTLLILDEAWLFLDSPLFASRIRDWLKTLRKKNVAVVFATQSLSDIASSTIAPAIIESCPTRIFLPNDRAIETQIREIYERFGLNSRQIEIISRATPKQDYYAQTARGNRLFELNLGPLALAICGASRPEDQRLMDQLQKVHDEVDFVIAFLRAKGFAHEADLIARATGQTGHTHPDHGTAQSPTIATGVTS
ncbi:MAG: conjugal transfer protein TrbE [Rhizobiales bacterium]|nr:conjugal transfer protein TrbE [Hyphomicrobiales bacterium]